MTDPQPVTDPMVVPAADLELALLPPHPYEGDGEGCTRCGEDVDDPWHDVAAVAAAADPECESFPVRAADASEVVDQLMEAYVAAVVGPLLLPFYRSPAVAEAS